MALRITIVQLSRSDLLSLGQFINPEGIMIYSAWHEKAPFNGTLAGKRMNNSDFVAKYKAMNGKLPDEDVAITFALCQGIDQAVNATRSVDNDKIMIAQYPYLFIPEGDLLNEMGNYEQQHGYIHIDNSI